MQVRNASNVAKPRAESGLSIVIVTYNSAAVLPGLLDSLPAGLEGIMQFETIVVDNDSADGSVDIALAHPARPRVIRTGRNAGYAAAINVGAAAAGPNTDLLILNPDIRLLPGSVRLLIDRLTDLSVGVTVPRILAEDGTTRWSLRREPSVMRSWNDAVLGGTLAGRIGNGETIGDPAMYDQDGLVEWASGAILAVAARTRAVVGDWDESFFLYMEEVDYLRRVREHGFSVAYVPQSRAVHLEGEYSENPRLSAMLATNRIRYHRRHHGPLSTVLFRLSIIVGSGLRPSRAAGAKAALRGRYVSICSRNTAAPTIVVGVKRPSPMRSLVAGLIGLALATVLRIPGASSEVVQFRGVVGGQDYRQFSNPLPSDPGYFPIGVRYQGVVSQADIDLDKKRVPQPQRGTQHRQQSVSRREKRHARHSPAIALAQQPDCHGQSRCRKLVAVRPNRHAAGAGPGLRDHSPRRCATPERLVSALQ